MSEIIVSEQHKQAVALHQKIVSSAELAQQNLWEMCVSLKQMRDDKLYKELGYSNFEDYCENEVGFSRMQAHKYISIIENIRLENVNSSLQIGMTKLYLLSTISEQEQAEIAEKVNLESTTVKQLKAEIDKLKEEKSKNETDMEKLKDQVNTLTTNIEDAQEQVRHERKRREELADRLDDANEQIKELESRPVEVAVVDNSAENDRKLQEVIRSLERENIKQNEELERSYRKQEEDVRRMLTLEKENALAQLKATYEQKIAEFPKAEPVDESKIKFKICLTAAYDSCKRVLELSKENNLFKLKATELFHHFLAELED